MIFLDSIVIDFFQCFSRQSYIFDSILNFLAGNDLIKGGIMISLFYFGWFASSKDIKKVRAHLIATILGCFAAIFIARTLATFLPYRLRPIHEKTLNFVLPYTVNPDFFNDWSSMPSDHAVLFFALAVGIFYISKRLGLIAILYSTLVICIPRIYLGLHYTTDVIVGALVGVMIVLFFNASFIIKRISTPIFEWSEKKPEFFYPIFFLITFQIAELFDSARDFLKLAYPILEQFKQ